MIDRIRTIDEATPRERQRIFALLDRCGLSIVDPPSGDLGVVYVTFLPWRADGKRWAYLGRSDNWCLRYHGSGKAIFHAKRVRRRGEFIKICIDFAERGAPLIALEDTLQIQAGIRRTREEPMHRDWLNVVAHGGGGHQNATKEQMSRGGRKSVESGHIDRLTKSQSHRDRGSTSSQIMVSHRESMRSDLEYWTRLHPDRPTAINVGAKENPSCRGNRLTDEMIVVPVANPSRAGQPTRPDSVTTKWRTLFLERPRTVSELKSLMKDLFPVSSKYRKPNIVESHLRQSARYGWLALTHEGRVVLGPGCLEPRLRWDGEKWLRGRVVSRGAVVRPPPNPLGWDPGAVGGLRANDA